LLCTEDDNSCYRNVCKMSVVSFALAVVFIMVNLYFCSNLRILKLTQLCRDYVGQTFFEARGLNSVLATLGIYCWPAPRSLPALLHSKQNMLDLQRNVFSDKPKKALKYFS